MQRWLWQARVDAWGLVKREIWRFSEFMTLPSLFIGEYYEIG